MLLGQTRKLGIRGDARFHRGRFVAAQLAIEPGKEFVIHVRHCSPTMANSAVRPRTSRLDTVPIGKSSISETSR